MKKIISLLTALVWILLCGCTPVSDTEETSAFSDSLTETDVTVTETTETSLSDTSETTESTFYCSDFTFAKPVIYLDPEEKTEISVSIDWNGALTHTYPAYEDGWHVLAFPDGKLKNLSDGREHDYLFWEGKMDAVFDMSCGFVVKGEDTVPFLQDILAKMGLTDREANDFIVYWLPYMENNPYNLITFQNEAYAEMVHLKISPTPKSVLRVFMVFRALEEPISVDAPEITPFERDGFTVVEWGGGKR